MGSCCGKRTATNVTNTLTLKDLDYWLFSGFDGLINLFQKRALGNTQPLSLDNLQLLKSYLAELEARIKQLETFPVQEPDIDSFLLNCLGELISSMKTRIRYQVRNNDTLQMLKINCEKMRGILTGYQASEQRAQSPREQGRRDKVGGWHNRGSKLYQQSNDITEYDIGYNN